MASDEKDFQGAQEIGKIFDSFMEKSVLCRFFLESVMNFIQASEGYLYLSGEGGKLWLEDQIGSPCGKADLIPDQINQMYQKGQPVGEKRDLFIPLIARNAAMGLAHFKRSPENSDYSNKDLQLAVNLSYQAATALKNLMLIEENVRMARLAAVGQTVSVVMHEVKNIIQLAKFAHDYLSRGVQKKDERYILKGLDGVKKSLNDMDGFIYEMLSLTKNYKIHPKPFRFQDVLEELRRGLSDKAQHMKVKLDFQVKEPFGEVYGEQKSIYRAILNIAKNALEARDRQKECYLKVLVQGKDENTYEVIIEDNGTGLSDEVKAKLFQAFFSTKGEQGTGLGLMIIDRTIKAHHGEVKVESEFGKWTRFILILPRVMREED